MPPKSWDINELRLAEAIDTGPTRPSNLTRPVDKIFEQKYWEVSKADYELLLPSLRLASHWVDVAMPYIATFLPSNSLWEALELDNNQDEPEIQLRTGITSGNIKEARKELDELAEAVLTWQVNTEMFKDRGWLGITRLTNQPRPWDHIFPHAIMKRDAKLKQQGYNRRRIIIGIMGEYLATLRDFPSTSETHLRASFMVAYTVTHELGHAIFHQDFRSIEQDSNGPEPFVDGDHWAELGFSFMSWIFSGFNPNVSDMKDGQLVNFSNALNWEPHLKIKDERPVYKPLYSISIKYMQNLFTQSFWDDLGDSTKLNFSALARGKLKPSIDVPKAAMAMKPEFEINAMGELDWILRHQDRGFQLDLEPVLTEEEIALVRKAKKPAYEDFGAAFGGGEGDDDSDGGNFGGPPSVPRRAFSASEIQQQFDAGHVDDDEDPGYSIESDLRSKVQDNNFTSDIDDGILEKDCTFYGPRKTELTRIVVRYLPDVPPKPALPSAPGTSSKRSRPRGNDNSNSQSSKRQRKAWGAPECIDDDQDVDSLIQYWSILSMENRFTNIQALNFCQKRGISDIPFRDTEEWQQSRLQTYDSEDMAIMQRMRYNVFNLAQEKFKKEKNREAVLKLKRELQRSAGFWDENHLRDHCRDKSLDDEGNVHELLSRVILWYRNEMLRLQKHNAEGVSSRRQHLNVPLIPDPNEDDDLSTWTAEDFDAYFRKNNLPTWGTMKCKRHRLTRFSEELKNGGLPSPRDSNSVYKRTDKKGYEKYVFRAVLHRSSTASLKSALFITGRFPPETVMTLFFGADMANPMLDGPLLQYATKDWSNIRLKVAERWPWQNTKEHALYVPGDKPDVYIPKDMRPAPQTQGPNLGIPRKVDIISGIKQPTAAELSAEIQGQGVELEKAMMPSGGRDILRPHLNKLRSQSGVDILNSLQDMKGVKTLREDNLVDLVGDADSEENVRGHVLSAGKPGVEIDLTEVDNEDDLPPGASHMVDLFRSI